MGEGCLRERRSHPSGGRTEKLAVRADLFIFVVKYQRDRSGNPCRIIRKITAEDKDRYFRG